MAFLYGDVPGRRPIRIAASVTIRGGSIRASAPMRTSVFGMQAARTV
jgi:hypothetical protein